MSKSTSAVFLRILWEPADSPKLAEVYRQAEACLRHDRKPPRERWLANGKHNVDWLVQHGIPPRYTKSLFHAILDAVREYGAIVWLGLDLLNVYKIRPRLFWQVMAAGQPVRFGLQKVGKWQDGGGVCEPYPKAIYCRDEKVAAMLLEEAKQGKPIGDCLEAVRDALGIQPFDPKLDLPIVRHPRNVKPPDPAIFQERKQVWRIAPHRLLGGNDPDTTIVIAARNQRGFLGEAIQSALDQTAPARIVYVDDGSDDGSVGIASRFPVKVLRQAHQGAVAARNAGLAEAKGEYVLFLDGDDKLPPDYLTAKLATIKQPGVDFVYSPVQHFGDSDRLGAVPDWSPAGLWCHNYVNTATLFRRLDLLEVGDWRPTLEQNCWDWDLVLRLAAKGKRGMPERTVPLLYRRHAGGLSVNRTIEEQVEEGFLVRNGAAQTAILSIYSGRLGERLFCQWMDALCESIAGWTNALQSVVTKRPFAAKILRPKLFIIATNGYDGLRSIPRGYADSFDSVSLTIEQWDTASDSEEQRGRKASVLIADAYNRMILSSGCQLIWTVEDDILVPSNAMRDLNRTLLWGLCYAVSGTYRNRHTPEYILGGNQLESPQGLACEQFRTIEKDRWVTMAGTGCLMWSRFLVSHLFEPWYNTLGAHDWNWSQRLVASKLAGPDRKEVLLVSDVKCRHYQTAEVWV